MNIIPSTPSYNWISHFAGEYIASCNDLQTRQDFPHDIWQKMGKAGFFKLGIARSYGGAGGGYSELVAAGEAFVENGKNMGLALSWLYQQIAAIHLISGFANREQREQYLPLMAQGELLASFAVSEPKRGAHPKLLTTSAQIDHGHYILNGEKTYLTNGPIANLFIVIAITDSKPLYKKFSAFLVPRESEGLKLNPPLELNFLKPSPHGGIVLNDCRLPASSILGNKGMAYKDMVIPFGDVEEIVMLGATAGGMAAIFGGLLAAIRKKKIEQDKLLQGELGSLYASLQTLRTIASEAAQKLDQGEPSPIFLTLTFSHLAAQFQAGIALIVSRINLDIESRHSFLQADINALAQLKKKNIHIKQEKLGAALLKETS
jgi:alkylation response protein AidB-like acyl-CoA dehydrogenase